MKARTTRTLTILFISVIVGSGVLMLMETDPISVQQPSLTAMVKAAPADDKIVFETFVPVQPAKWSNIVVRTSPKGNDNIAQACHFVVDLDSNTIQVKATELWKRQSDGYHTFAPGHDWNADSIGISVAGIDDISQLQKDPQKFARLLSMVRSLQHHMNIPAERVYLHSDIDQRTAEPTEAFLVSFLHGLLNTH